VDRIHLQHLKGQLSLEEHDARTDLGVYTCTAQRLLAMATAIWQNWAIGAPGNAP
jgi:hypothetical protein